MNAPHLRLSGHSHSIYDSSIPASQEEALQRRQLLDAGQRAFRETAEGRVRPDPGELGLPGRRFRGGPR
jgi:hypothetical protein